MDTDVEREREETIPQTNHIKVKAAVDTMFVCVLGRGLFKGNIIYQLNFESFLMLKMYTVHGCSHQPGKREKGKFQDVNMVTHIGHWYGARPITMNRK